MNRKKDGSALLPRQISDTIRERIFSGEYAPGKKLPPIRKFAEDFSVCPVTILKALEVLEEEQLIERIPERMRYDILIDIGHFLRRHSHA